MTGALSQHRPLGYRVIGRPLPADDLARLVSKPASAAA
jgi:hypothetical protein